jgi:hypothetical protein
MSRDQRRRLLRQLRDASFIAGAGNESRIALDLGPPGRFYGRDDWPELEAEALAAWNRTREKVMADCAGGPRPWAYFMFDRPRADTIPGPQRDALLAAGRLTAAEAAMMAWSHAQLAYGRIHASRPGETTADWLADPALIEKSLALNGWNVFTEEEIDKLRHVNAPPVGDTTARRPTTEEEIAAMREPLQEIVDLRARLARLEAVAAEARDFPKGSLGDSLSDAMNPLRPPVDPARRRLEAEARGFVPDPQSEAAIVARAKDPRAYDREMGRVHVGGLEAALYANQRAAAIKLGTFVPESEGDES